MSAPIRLKAPAKINITLEVVKKLRTGYHAIRSVFVRLDDLFDTIDVKVTDDRTSIALSCTSGQVPTDESNTCHRAAAAYLAAIGQRACVRIHINKNIPIAAGLGGGSSDAAAVLLALNTHFKRRLSPRKLEVLGASVGKDVPFFIGGGKACYVSGMGEDLRPIADFPRSYFLIVNPGLLVSTAEAYQAIGQAVWFMAHRDRANISAAMVRAIRSKDRARMAAGLFNDFEASIETAHPVVKEIKQALLAFGARGALMTGSGPTVFGLFASKKALLQSARNLRRRYPGLVATST
jgi:4-diphosphocytidyl-2-C-methyl-D-erythritol kinase